MKKGDKVEWNWGTSKAEGEIVKEYDKPVTKTIKGARVKRNASKAEPAYEIEQEKGNKVLKSESELKASPKPSPTACRLSFSDGARRGLKSAL